MATASDIRNNRKCSVSTWLRIFWLVQFYNSLFLMVFLNYRFCWFWNWISNRGLISFWSWFCFNFEKVLQKWKIGARSAPIFHFYNSSKSYLYPQINQLWKNKTQKYFLDNSKTRTKKYFWNRVPKTPSTNKFWRFLNKKSKTKAILIFWIGVFEL